MTTQAIQGGAPALEASHRSRDVGRGTAEAPRKNGAGFLGNLGHGLWAMSFQLGIRGPSGLPYKDSRALSVKDKVFLHALTMGYIQ